MVYWQKGTGYILESCSDFVVIFQCIICLILKCVCVCMWLGYVKRVRVDVGKSVIERECVRIRECMLACEC